MPGLHEVASEGEDSEGTRLHVAAAQLLASPSPY